MNIIVLQRLPTIVDPMFDTSCVSSGGFILPMYSATIETKHRDLHKRFIDIDNE